MALFRRLFYRKPPDRLLEIGDRVYVFDCCFSSERLEEDEYKDYMNKIMVQLQSYFPDASLSVFNFREEGRRNLLAEILAPFNVSVIEYPDGYHGCPVLPMGMVYQFLRFCDNWLSTEGQRNVLLMHCERGGWPVLSFMLACLMLYRRQYSGKERALEMMYKQAPREFLQILTPLNPSSSHLRYLRYITGNGSGLQWPLCDVPYILDCLILRDAPYFDGKTGFRPIVRVYGRDPSNPVDECHRVLFTSLENKEQVHNFREEDDSQISLDVHCSIQGDVVLECIHMDGDLELEEMLFRIMFNTAFIQNNVLLLNREEIDIIWGLEDQFTKNFKAEVKFSEFADGSNNPQVVAMKEDEVEGEEFFEAEEIFSNPDLHDETRDLDFHSTPIKIHDVCMPELVSDHEETVNSNLHFVSPIQNLKNGPAQEMLISNDSSVPEMATQQQFGASRDGVQRMENENLDMIVETCIQDLAFVEENLSITRNLRNVFNIVLDCKKVVCNTVSVDEAKHSLEIKLPKQNDEAYDNRAQYFQYSSPDFRTPKFVDRSAYTKINSNLADDEMSVYETNGLIQDVKCLVNPATLNAFVGGAFCHATNQLEIKPAHQPEVSFENGEPAKVEFSERGSFHNMNCSEFGNFNFVYHNEDTKENHYFEAEEHAVSASNELDLDPKGKKQCDMAQNFKIPLLCNETISSETENSYSSIVTKFNMKSIHDSQGVQSGNKENVDWIEDREVNHTCVEDGFVSQNSVFLEFSCENKEDHVHKKEHEEQLLDASQLAPSDPVSIVEKGKLLLSAGNIEKHAEILVVHTFVSKDSEDNHVHLSYLTSTNNDSLTSMAPHTSSPEEGETVDSLTFATETPQLSRSAPSVIKEAYHSATTPFLPSFSSSQSSQMPESNLLCLYPTRTNSSQISLDVSHSQTLQLFSSSKDIPPAPCSCSSPMLLPLSTTSSSNNVSDKSSASSLSSLPSHPPSSPPMLHFNAPIDGKISKFSSLSLTPLQPASHPPLSNLSEGELVSIQPLQTQLDSIQPLQTPPPPPLYPQSFHFIAPINSNESPSPSSPPPHPLVMLLSSPTPQPSPISPMPHPSAREDPPTLSYAPTYQSCPLFSHSSNYGFLLKETPLSPHKSHMHVNDEFPSHSCPTPSPQPPPFPQPASSSATFPSPPTPPPLPPLQSIHLPLSSTVSRSNSSGNHLSALQLGEFCPPAMHSFSKTQSASELLASYLPPLPPIKLNSPTKSLSTTNLTPPFTVRKGDFDLLASHLAFFPLAEFQHSPKGHMTRCLFSSPLHPVRKLNTSEVSNVEIITPSYVSLFHVGSPPPSGQAPPASFSQNHLQGIASTTATPLLPAVKQTAPESPKYQQVPRVPSSTVAPPPLSCSPFTISSPMQEYLTPFCESIPSPSHIVPPISLPALSSFSSTKNEGAGACPIPSFQSPLNCTTSEAPFASPSASPPTVPRPSTPCPLLKANTCPPPPPPLPPAPIGFPSASVIKGCKGTPSLPSLLLGGCGKGSTPPSHEQTPSPPIPPQLPYKEPVVAPPPPAPTPRHASPQTPTIFRAPRLPPLGAPHPLPLPTFDGAPPPSPLLGRPRGPPPPLLPSTTPGGSPPPLTPPLPEGHVIAPSSSPLPGGFEGAPSLPPPRVYDALPSPSGHQCGAPSPTPTPSEGVPPPMLSRAPSAPPPPPRSSLRGPQPPLGSMSGGRGLGFARAGVSATAIKKSSLKPLHWVKVTRAMQGSLWAELQKHADAQSTTEFDILELETLFSAVVKKPDSSKLEGRKSVTKSEKVHLIDLRRANNTEIMLTKIKMPLSDMMKTALALDESILDGDQVENLLKFCPTKEEMELLKYYTGDKENLGKCEKFFLELMKVPRVEAKLRVFCFKIQFNAQTADIRKSLYTVDSIRNSIKLKDIMKKILSLGNTLNQGTARGAAVGFRLDSLLKLTDTRAVDNKMTLMHYLCKVIDSKSPHLIDFHEDLISLEAASKIQLKALAEEQQGLVKGLAKVEMELTASGNDGIVSEVFCKKLKDFTSVAGAEVRSLTAFFAAVGINADGLALYFGEDPARCPFEQVITTLMNFVRMFRSAHEENCKLDGLEKKKVMKEADTDKPKSAISKKKHDKRAC
ncbi:formin-like protein 6 isoform X3 [Phalaenopsis equestris]|uniref:formin-like protein 6 isoform X3 n=1 Tax=Phalaenopsis equestris TaxID=78828 RepID=UPI0009E519C2|nr:formin-like protein 6 isoform X3 [Phalaenopsis equestris]